MSLDIFDRGEGRFDLMHGGADLGWVADGTIGFGGVEGRSAARRAAAIAYEALTGWLARQRRMDRVPNDARSLRVHRVGAQDQLTLGDVPVGRLVHQRDDAHGSGEYGFELVLPPRVGASLSAAQVMYHALARRRMIRTTVESPALA